MLKKLSKQDRQGVRKPSDVERKYNLGEVVQTVRVIQEANVPGNVLDGYYTKGELDYKIDLLRQDLESKISNGDYRIVNDVVEWFNPPMDLDTEYRTTERWLGEIVYTKLVTLDISVVGNTEGIHSFVISVSTPNFNSLVRYSGNVTGSSPVTLPYFNSDGGYMGLNYMNSSEIGIVMNKKLFLSDSHIYIQVWYTKIE